MSLCVVKCCDGAGCKFGCRGLWYVSQDVGMVFESVKVVSFLPRGYFLGFHPYNHVLSFFKCFPVASYMYLHTLNDVPKEILKF